MQLGWTDVREMGGTAVQAFACDTVGGSHVIVLSFVAPDSVVRFVAADVVLELQAEGERLPAWWEFRNSESCRTLSLRLDLTAASRADSGVRVLSPWDEGRNGLAVLTGYRRDADDDPRAALITASMARPISKPIALEGGVRYVACKMVIDNRRTFGEYSCEGCRDPISIRVRELTLLEADGRKTILTPGYEACVGWQGAACGRDHASR